VAQGEVEFHRAGYFQRASKSFGSRHKTVDEGGLNLSGRKQEQRLSRFEGEAVKELDALMKAASRITGNRDEAEDIVQETFLRAWKYFDSFDSGSNCRAWLFRIMFNVINNRAGRRLRLQETPLETDDGEDHKNNIVVFDPLKQIEGREVLEATKLLTEEYRSVLWLVVVEEFSYKETAEILGVPIGTVMSRLHRARRDLRKILVTDRATGANN
jgi:RNA polymerase sigma-70 factor (ECF subfamily)